MRFGYSAKQLVRYYRFCIANPNGFVLPPGGQRHWDDMSVSAWLRWFRECLTKKVSKGSEAAGKGNRAARRIKCMADAKAECKWCGRKTGSSRQQFCSASCKAVYCY